VLQARPPIAVLNQVLELWNSGQTDRAVELLRQHAAMPNLDAETLLGYPSTRLAVYGSLAPGKSNHRMLAGLRGSWRPVTAHGVLEDHGWGAGLGFPAFTWDPAADPVAMLIFESPDLPGHWKTLDEFEGADYRRILVPVISLDRVEVAYLYAAAK
jgi:gamma-glutamylcyclotransferase (GGCT)/AIG2-like uncharacterized protein YtfP